jgi:hypothetical protein
MLAFFGVVGVSLAVMGWVGGALTWDGAQYLLKIVDQQSLFQPFERFGSAPFEFPVLWASSHTSSVVTLRHVFGLSYAVAPFGALIASWLVIRGRAPGLMIWPALGIGLVALPGLLFPVSEAVILAEWAWPLYLVTLLGLHGRTWAAGVGFAVFLFYLHPDSVLVFGVVALIALVRARDDAVQRRRLIAWAVAMLATAVVRYVVLHQDFVWSGHGFNLSRVANDLFAAEFGLPIASYVLVVAAGFVTLALRHSKLAPERPWWKWVPVSFVSLAGISLVVYASTFALWKSALNVHDIVIFLELPLVLFAVVDLLAPTPGLKLHRRPDIIDRGPILMVSGVTMAVALVLWSLSWSTEMKAVSHEVSTFTTYCVSPEALSAALATSHHSIKDWAEQQLVIDLQTRTPAHLELSATQCQSFHDQGLVELRQFEAPVHGGWIRFVVPSTG